MVTRAVQVDMFFSIQLIMMISGSFKHIITSCHVMYCRGWMTFNGAQKDKKKIKNKNKDASEAGVLNRWRNS